MKHLFPLALASLGLVSGASAIPLPYATGFETSDLWSSNAPASNPDWSGLNNWRTTTSLSFAGAQSLQASALATSLPNSTATPTSIPTSQNKGTVSASVRMSMGSTVAGTATPTGANAVYGFATRVLDNFGRLNRFAVQNDGGVYLFSNFAYTKIGALSTSAFQNQWLDLSLSLNTTLGSQIAYTFGVKDATGASLFSGTGNLLTGSTVVTTEGLDYVGLVYANNGGSGSQIYGNVAYDAFAVQAVPEPGALAALGLGALALVRRRR